jgi:hypothetical protein
VAKGKYLTAKVAQHNNNNQAGKKNNHMTQDVVYFAFVTLLINK